MKKVSLNDALAKAIEKGNLTKLRKALTEGADPNVTLYYTAYGFREEKTTAAKKSPLMLASSYEDDALSFEMVKELMDAGATVDLKDETEPRETALIEAVMMANYKTAHYLMEKGANVGALGLCATGLVHAVCGISHKLYAKMNREAGGYEENKKEVEKSKNEFLKFLLKKMPENDLDVSTEINRVSTGASRMAPLCYTCWAGFADLTRTLLENGADPNGNTSWETPLMCAAEEGAEECCDLLIRAGANTELKGLLSQKTAAQTARAKGFVELANGLKDWGKHTAKKERAELGKEGAEGSPAKKRKL